MEIRDNALQEQMQWWADHATEATSLLDFAIGAIESGESIEENIHLAYEAILLIRPHIGKIRSGLQYNGVVSNVEVSSRRGHAQVLKRRADIEAYNNLPHSQEQEADEGLREVEYTYARVIRMVTDYRLRLLRERGSSEPDEELETLKRFAKQAEARIYDLTGTPLEEWRPTFPAQDSSTP